LSDLLELLYIKNPDGYFLLNLYSMSHKDADINLLFLGGMLLSAKLMISAVIRINS